jgi:Galactose oxidase, central domain
MNRARQYHTATLLFSGEVLITGGGDPTGPGIFATAELFDPATDTFTAVGDMTTPRKGHTATLLPDGRVLIAGGFDSAALGTAELYDPKTRTFTRTEDMVASGGAATLLDDGKVLIAGLRPQLFDPATGTFTATLEYAPTPRNLYGEFGILGPATLLPNGKVLIAGEPSTQIYDPVTGTFSLGGTMATGRGPGGVGQPPWYIEGRTATLLGSGMVLLTGGEFEDGGVFADADLYNPATGKFTSIHNMSRTRSHHTATLLRDGTVLLAGGFSNSLWAIDTNELYDSASDNFWPTANLTFGRSFHTATLLMDGRVLLAGGFTGYPDNAHSASGEVYIPSLLIPTPVVETVRFDPLVVPAGSSYSVDVSGFNLTPDMFFDVRFISPKSNESVVVLNWQKGLTASHEMTAEIAMGNWKITGVRAHQIETDHTGSFFPVSATISVSP